ncbi:MAG: hypothetical protein K6G81_11235 [Lachnospiraceae bacterium]|nr:hypothetical protein [Lachnospiraceae bacterium]
MFNMKSLINRNIGRFKAGLSLTLAALLVLASVTGGVRAATKVSISDSEYNLYADDVPAEIGEEVFSKFTTKVSEPDEYSIVFDEDSAIDGFTAALDKNNIAYEEDFLCCFKATVYDWSGDEEKAITGKGVESYFPLPFDAQEYSEYCAFYKLSGSTLTQVYPLPLYEINDSLYVKLSFSAASDFAATYGFVYVDPDTLEEEDPDDEEDPEEDEEPDDEPTSAPAPTSKPAATPTVAPTAAPTGRPVVTSTPTPAQKPSSNQESSGNNGSGGSSASKPSSNSSKDSIPRTGDDFPLGAVTVGAVCSLAVLAGAVVLLTKGKGK